MAQYMLKLPVEFYQADTMTCWASAAASWLHATQIGVATDDQLLARFRDYENMDGSLPMPDGTPDRAHGKPGGMKEVYNRLAIYVFKMDRGDFTESWLRDTLKAKGHLIQMLALDSDDNIWHAKVIYGVGYPDGNYSVFDPLHTATPGSMVGFLNVPLADINMTDLDYNMWIGWAKWAGP
jgi:hypothetical protein